jgi:hypothetical protein
VAGAGLAHVSGGALGELVLGGSESSIAMSCIELRYSRPQNSLSANIPDPAAPEIAGPGTAADYVLGQTHEVERFLDALARGAS